jgi:preprotein translocase subunit SecG
MKNDLMPGVKTPAKNDQIISYYALRILIGATGVLLPLLLIIGNFFASNTLRIEDSVSDYYDNSTAGDILVGVLFVLGFFLMTYKGYDKVDSRTANLGCIFALGVALFPTTSTNHVIHIMHFVFALLLFTVFIFFSVYLFRKSDPAKKCTRQKNNRNRIYLICGIIMIACIAGIAVSMLFLENFSKPLHLVFWLESIALIAFGISWIVKAEFLFMKDKQNGIN